MPDWKQRLHCTFEANGTRDADVLEELSTHAATAYETLRAQGHDASEASSASTVSSASGCARPRIWAPFRQAPQAITSIMVRAEPGHENAIAQVLRQTITSADPAHMVRRVVTLTDRVNRALTRERLLLRLAIGFGIVAMLLAAVGLYGFLAHAVARRTREIGVRVALGAEPEKMIAMVLREGGALRGPTGRSERSISNHFDWPISMRRSRFHLRRKQHHSIRRAVHYYRGM